MQNEISKMHTIKARRSVFFTNGKMRSQIAGLRWDVMYF